MSISKSNTQSPLAIANFIASIDAIKASDAFGSTTPNWLQGQVQTIAKSLALYLNDGGDPTTLPQGVRASEILVNSVAGVLESDYISRPFVDDEWFHDTVNCLVLDVYAITELLGEGSYGLDLCDRYNAFAVQTAEL